MKIFLCADRLCYIPIETGFCWRDGNIFDTQRVSAFRIFYYEPEPGSYKRDDNGKYMGNR